MIERASICGMMLIALGLMGAPCGGPVPQVVLVASTSTLRVNETVTVRVESREGKAMEAFAFTLTYPTGTLTPIGGVSLAHGANDLSFLPSSQPTGQIVINAANTVNNPSLVEPTKGVVLAEIQFRANATGTADLTLQSAKLAQSYAPPAGQPVTSISRPSVAIGAPLSLQVNP